MTMNFKMDLTVILDAFKKVDFNGCDAEISEEDYMVLEEVQETLDEEMNFPCDFATGATKFVILPEERDYVVKIPFNGRWESTYRSYSSDEEEYNEWEDTYEEKFFPWEGAGYEGSESGWDYCGREQWIYEQAQKYDIAEMFAGTTKIAEVRSYPIYASERAVVSYRAACYGSMYNDSETYTDFVCDYIKTHYDNDPHIAPNISYAFLGYMLYYYGEEKFDKFLHFAKDMSINDLHSDNVGFIGDRPVLIDYSGFWS